MSSHTPGPWRCSATGVVYVPGYAIAACQEDDDLEYRPRDEALANARLIAAAPDLLHSLKVLHNWINEADRPHWPSVRMDTALAESYVHLCEIIEQEYNAAILKADIPNA